MKAGVKNDGENSLTKEICNITCQKTGISSEFSKNIYSLEFIFVMYSQYYNGNSLFSVELYAKRMAKVNCRNL